MTTKLLPILVIVCTLWANSQFARGSENSGSRSPSKLKVFLFAGQSNMEGKGDGSKLTPEEKELLARAQKHVRFAYNREPIAPLYIRTAPPGNKYGVDHMFGPELFFGLRLAEAWPDDQILLIKRSVGATSLFGRWNPDWTREKAARMGEENAPPLYSDFVSYIHEVLAGYSAEQYEICGAFWVQGEADSRPEHGPEPAETYGRNLQNLIGGLRRETGVPDLPFVILQVGSGRVVDGMKEAARDLKNVSFIPRSHDPDSPNYLQSHKIGHFNYEGQKRIGNLFADLYLQKYAARVP